MDGISATEHRAGDQKPEAAHAMRSLTLFRALAILQIAFLHASHALFRRGLSGPDPESDPIFVSVDISFHGSTIYFAMISGFVYQHLFVGLPYRSYLRGRLERVAIPYLVVTVALTLAQHPVSLRELSPELLETLAHNIATGATWNTLWYIPVLLAIYALAPLISSLLSSPALHPVGLLLILAPLVVSRSGTDPSLANLIYFTGAFAVGIELRRAQIDFRRDDILIFALLISMASTIMLVTVFVMDVDRLGPVSLRETLFYIQKIALGCAMLSCIQRSVSLSDHGRPLLTHVAGCSFGIYFLHGPLMRLAAKAVGPYLDGNDFEYLCGIILILLLALGASLLIIHVLQKLFGRASRWIIGA